MDDMSIAVDESTDKMNAVQPPAFVRYFNGEALKVVSLCLLPLLTNAPREAIFDAVKGFFDKHSLDMSKINILH